MQRGIGANWFQDNDESVYDRVRRIMRSLLLCLSSFLLEFRYALDCPVIFDTPDNARTSRPFFLTFLSFMSNCRQLPPRLLRFFPFLIHPPSFLEKFLPSFRRQYQDLSSIFINFHTATTSIFNQFTNATSILVSLESRVIPLLLYYSIHI